MLGYPQLWVSSVLRSIPRRHSSEFVGIAKRFGTYLRKKSPTTTILRFGANFLGRYGGIPCLHFWLKGLKAVVMDGLDVPPEVAEYRRQWLVQRALGGRAFRWGCFVALLAHRAVNRARAARVYAPAWLRQIFWNALAIQDNREGYVDSESSEEL